MNRKIKQSEEINVGYNFEVIFGNVSTFYTILRVTSGEKYETVSSFKKPTLQNMLNPYPTAFPYGNGMVLHFYQQQESSTTKTVHKVINKGLKAYV